MTKFLLAVITLVLLASPALAEQAEPTLADESLGLHDHPDDDHNDTPFPFVAALVGLVAVAGLMRRHQ